MITRVFGTTMRRPGVLSLAIALAFALACTAGDSAELTKAGDEKLKKNDLPGASAEYDKARKDNPESVYAAQADAYTLMLQGKYADADKALSDAASHTEDPNVKGEIEMRRAIVALRAGKLDDVKTHGAASKLPAGEVLAAEVHLVDAESDEARKLLNDASKDNGVVGETAKGYLALLDSDNPLDQTLAEATALWSLGQRDTAVETAEEIVKGLPEEREDKNTLLLLWAGRAVTSGRPGIATGMLDAMGAPPEGQAWRVQATRAMIAIAEGDNQTGIDIFTQLSQAGAPADGLSDALATAAALTNDPTTAQMLAGAVEGNTGARGLEAGGAHDAAVEKAKGAYGKYLGAK